MNEYYSVIQLLATIAIGFVILDYSRVFAETIKSKFFNLEDFLMKAVAECLALIPEAAIRNILTPTKVGDGDTSRKIEELKVGCEAMEAKVKDFKTRRKKEIDSTNILNSLSSMSLFVFLTTLTMIFIPSMKFLNDNAIELFMLPFSILCVIYLILGWIFGERENRRKVLRFNSMRHATTCFVLIFLLSVALAVIGWLHSFDASISKYFFVMLIVAGWVNFLVYAFFIRRSILRFKSSVEEEKNSIIAECKSLELKKNYDDLITVKKMAEQASDFAADFTQKQEGTDNPTPPTDPK